MAKKEDLHPNSRRHGKRRRADLSQDALDISKEPIKAATHRQLVGNTKRICERFNNDPDLARLLLVNPVFAFEDAGVVMSPEIKAHIRKTLRRPAALEQRRVRLQEELQRTLAKTKFGSIPRHRQDRARLLFEELDLKPIHKAHRDGLSLRDLELYREHSKTAAKLAAFERASRGGFTMHTRGSYNQFKRGGKRHRVKAVRFKL